MSTKDITLIDPIEELVSTAVQLKNLKSLSEMLKIIAHSVGAYGCVIWEVVPGSNLESHPPQGRLFVLDQWLEDERPYYFYDLAVHSAAGETVLTQMPVNVINVDTDPRVSRNPKYLHMLGVKTLLSVPVIFPDEKRKGALTVYRKVQKPFDEAESSLIQQLALLVPLLYQTIRVKSIYDLTGHVSYTLNRASARKHVIQTAEDNINITRELTRRAFATICNQVSSAFQCIETSIFLEDRTSAPGRYELIATTWPEPFEKTVYSQRERSLTGWVLTRGKSVRIFDLSNYERDKAAIQHDYKGISWTDSLNIKESVKRFLNLKDGSALPPLSFMSTPLMIGHRVLGAIRCCTVTKGPFHFAEADLNLLELVAAQITQYWSNWLSEIVIQEENISWQAFSEKIGRLNTFVLDEITQDHPNEDKIFNETLHVARSAIRGAEITDVRLLNESTRELCFKATHGPAWERGSRDERLARKNVCFKVDLDPPTSVGAHVFQSGETYTVFDVSKDPFYSKDVLFTDVNQMIVTPIKFEDKIFGVLDIRGLDKRGFPNNAIPMAELLGKQLGLYHYLVSTIGKLHKAETDLQNQVKERIQTMEDLAHQIKSPINQTHARIQSILGDRLGVEKITQNLHAIRGLSRKAKCVAMSTRLFAALARNTSVKLELSKLGYDYIVKALIEAADDNQLMIEPEHRIRMTVHKKGFEILDTLELKADRDLLEQAINNLLDNAGKYSYKNTVVEISGGLTRSRRFYISFVNYGLPIKSSEINDCIKRGWRSQYAEWTTGEGSGIGLWIVNQIMTMHGGALQITPTSAQNKTEITLLFPSSR